MANHEMPRRGCAAANGLVTVYGLGGVVRIPGWMKVADWKGTQIQFCSNVVDRLERAGLISVEGNLCTITNSGRKFLGKPVDGETVTAAPAGPRYTPPTRTLDLARHFPVRLVRLVRPEGLDYRNIPSLIGASRIEYQPGAVAANA